MGESCVPFSLKVRCPGLQARTAIATGGFPLRHFAIEGGCLRIPHRYCGFGRIIMRLHKLPVLFVLQVAPSRSLRIRSRYYLATPAGMARITVGHKRRCTQRQEATSSCCMPIRACCQSVGCPQIHRLPMRTARGERQPASECSLSTGTGRARMRRSVEPAGRRIRW